MQDGTQADLELCWYASTSEQTGYAEIRAGSQVYYTYESIPSTVPRPMPEGLKQRIVDDFNALLGTTEEEKKEEMKEQVQVVREEVVNGCTIKMFYHTNVEFGGLNLDPDGDKAYYRISIDYPTNEFGKVSTSKVRQTQEEAESQFDTYVSSANQVYNLVDTAVFEGVEIKFNSTVYVDGTPANQNDFVKLSGNGFDETYTAGDVIRYTNPFGDSETIGELSSPLNPSVDVVVLQERISKVLNPPTEDPLADEDFVGDGILEVQSWGWYLANSPTSNFSPFQVCDLREVYTVSQTQGRILGLTDSDLFSDSGAVKLVVKENYQVILRIMTQESNYFVENIPSLDDIAESHTQYSFLESTTGRDVVNYEDTDKLTLVLNGGDSVEIDIDAEVGGIATFSVIKNNKQVVRGSPPKIDNETFLAIVEVTKSTGDPQRPTQEDTGGEVITEDSKPMTWIPVVIGGVLILVVMYMLLMDGDTE